MHQPGPPAAGCRLPQARAGRRSETWLAHGLVVVALVHGFAMLGFALHWTALAGLITIRTDREHVPFSLTRWSFTFPVGAPVNGVNGLAAHSGLVAVQVLAVIHPSASSPPGSSPRAHLPRLGRPSHAARAETRVSRGATEQEPRSWACARTGRG